MTDERKPHSMAYRAEESCPNCGSIWLRPALDLSDPDVKEIPIFASCAKCLLRRGPNTLESNS